MKFVLFAPRIIGIYLFVTEIKMESINDLLPMKKYNALETATTIFAFYKISEIPNYEYVWI